MNWLELIVKLFAMSLLALFLIYWLSLLEQWSDKQFSAKACLVVAVLSCLAYGCLFAVAFHHFHAPHWLRSLFSDNSGF